MTSGCCLILFLVAFAAAQDTSTPPTDELLTVAQRWGFGLLTGLGLSLLGFLAAFVLVLVGTNIQSEKFKDVVRVLFALACGTLIGDSMIHILAEAYASEASGINPFIVSGVFIGALLVFMWLEKLMEMLGITHSHWIDGDDHGHGHKHEGQHEHDHKKQACSLAGEEPTKQMANCSKVGNQCPIQLGDSNLIDAQVDSLPPPAGSSSTTLQPKPEMPAASETAAAPQPKSCLDNWKGKKSAGYMNLVGSLIHNFMDGLTVGLAFATGDKHVYTPMVIAVFSHEIPRELGDVAILLESKFNNMQAIMSNGIINLIAILGVIVGLATVNTSEEAKTYIMVFVAGNFIYIAADIWRHLFKGKWLGNLIQQLFFAVGVGAMYGIKFLEPAHQ